MRECIQHNNAQGTGQNLKEGIAHFLSVFSVYRLCVGEFAHVNADTIIASFTIILAISTIGLWGSTQRLAKDAASAAIRQSEETKTLQRAYLTGEPQGVLPGLDKRNIGFVGFKNVGHLPATDAHWFLQMEFSVERDFKPDITKIPLKEYYGNNLIVPGAEMRQAVYGDITKEDWKRVREGNGYVYVWGRILYADGFDKLRWTDVCHRYNFRGYQVVKGKPTLRPDGMRYHELGNDAE